MWETEGLDLEGVRIVVHAVPHCWRMGELTMVQCLGCLARYQFTFLSLNTELPDSISQTDMLLKANDLYTKCVASFLGSCASGASKS